MTLSARIEQAGEDDTRRLLEEAGGILLFAPVHDNGALESLPGKRIRFYRMLDAEAFLDAAMMLVPEGWSWSLGEMRGISKWRGWMNDHNTPDGLAVVHVDADATTPALALCAASLKARGL